MTIEILGIQETCQPRIRNFPAATHGWLHLHVCIDAQKITFSGYPLCTTRMLNHDPASICPGKWHEAAKRLFRRAFSLIPGSA